MECYNKNIRDIGIQDVILEGDSLVIYNALCEVSLPPSSVASIVIGVLDLCKAFRRIEFSHVIRKGNRPAHLLAKYAVGIDDFIVWMEENPCFLEQTLSHDVLS